MLNYLLYKLWSHNHNVSSGESLNMFWRIWLVCYSETEKKTTLDQALRGVLGDQIVSKLAAIYFKWSYRIELTCPVLWKPEIVAFLSAGWAEGELWWLPVSHLPEHRCSNRRFVTVWKKVNNERRNTWCCVISFKSFTSHEITSQPVIVRIISIVPIILALQQLT